MGATSMIHRFHLHTTPSGELAIVIFHPGGKTVIEGQQAKALEVAMLRAKANYNDRLQSIFQECVQNQTQSAKAA